MGVEQEKDEGLQSQGKVKGKGHEKHKLEIEDAQSDEEDGGVHISQWDANPKEGDPGGGPSPARVGPVPRALYRGEPCASGPPAGMGRRYGCDDEPAAVAAAAAAVSKRADGA